MDEEILERIEKQMEGTNLALAAVAEVLQKMDSRLSKEDAVEWDRMQKAQANYEQQEMVKAVATEVFQLLKEGTKTEEKGLDVSGDSRSAKATGKSPANADDSEKGAPIGTKIEEQQKTIQAALLRLADNDWPPKDKKDKKDKDKKKGKGGKSLSTPVLRNNRRALKSIRGIQKISKLDYM